MAAPTVDQVPAGARARALTERIARLAGDPGEEARDALALGLVDTLLAGDEPALRAAVDALRGARAGALTGGNAERTLGWLEAATSVIGWGLERSTAEQGLGAVAHGTRPWRFLSALEEAGRLGSSELRERLATDETQVSRTGRRLLEAGLVIRRKAGRQVFWELT